MSISCFRIMSMLALIVCGHKYRRIEQGLLNSAEVAT